MARTKLTKVDVIRHTFHNGPIQIYLGVENKFTAEVYGEWLQADSYDEIARKIYARIEATNQITFTPVIVVREIETFNEPQTDWSAHVGFHVSRIYYGIAGGKLYRLNWQFAEDHPDPEEQRAHADHWDLLYREEPIKEDLVLPCKIKGRYLIPYSEGTWNALLHLIQIIHGARMKLEGLLSDPDAAVLLDGVGQRLLSMALEAPKDQGSFDQ